MQRNCLLLIESVTVDGKRNGRPVEAVVIVHLIGGVNAKCQRPEECWSPRVDQPVYPFTGSHAQKKGTYEGDMAKGWVNL